MKEFTFGENKYYESLDYFSKNYPLSDLERHVDATIKLFIKRKLFRKLLENYGHKHNLSGYILLNAHGNKYGREWVYADGKREYIVQNFINRMDGKVLAILLKVCSPKGCSVHSKKSIIIHPKRLINFLDLIRGGNLRIYVPENGYLENSYSKLRRTIDSIL